MPPASALSTHVVVPRRFNGPRRSGNGGYSSGVFAGLVDGPAEVSLRSPVPLDAPLAVERGDPGLRVLHGDVLVAEVHPAGDLAVGDVPRVDRGEAHLATGGYTGTGLDVFACCYVCGPRRRDSFAVYAGAVGERALVATPWTPPVWAAGPDGAVLPEHVWAALDCPTYFASHLDGEWRLSFLVRMQARLDAPVLPDEEHVVVAWPLGTDRRKRHAASAVLGPAGDVLAVARALLVEAR
jgi:hypothetical protein